MSVQTLQSVQVELSKWGTIYVLKGWHRCVFNKQLCCLTLICWFIGSRFVHLSSSAFSLSVYMKLMCEIVWDLSFHQLQRFPLSWQHVTDSLPCLRPEVLWHIHRIGSKTSKVNEILSLYVRPAATVHPVRTWAKKIVNQINQEKSKYRPQTLVVPIVDEENIPAVARSSASLELLLLLEYFISKPYEQPE